LLSNPIHQGVLFGLLLGKPIGIFLLSELSVLLKLASLPSGVHRRQILAIGFLGGVGFTMALFISSLALSPEQEVFSKTGIIFGSLLAGIIGSILLKITLPKRAV
jgi:NhaA family Na+:H+ antiporter